MSLNRTRLIVGISAVAAVLGTAAVLPASAGTNGQHVTVCTGKHNPLSVMMWGTDNNGNFAQTARTQLGDGPSKCASFPNIWFKGAVTVRWYDKSNGYWEQYASVPVNQGSNDWYTIRND